LYIGKNYTNSNKCVELQADPINPCVPSPCGPNSQCKEINYQAVCSCLQSYVGSPPNCRPECVVNSECGKPKACRNLKCVDPCLNACGSNSKCKVINHSPICSCKEGFTGDPFSSCYAIQCKFNFCSLFNYRFKNIFLLSSLFLQHEMY